MDALVRKIHRHNDTVFFIRSSVENPYVYLRFVGVVKEVEIKEDKVYYRIQVKRVLESMSTIQKYMNRARFRVKNAIDSKYIDKFFYVYDIEERFFEEHFRLKYNNYYFDLPSLFVFSTESEMENELSKINKYLIDKLSVTTKELLERVKII